MRYCEECGCEIRESGCHNHMCPTNDGEHRNVNGEMIREGDIARITYDKDCGLFPSTCGHLGKVIRPGPITILEIEGVGIRSCVDEFLTIIG